MSWFKDEGARAMIASLEERVASLESRPKVGRPAGSKKRVGGKGSRLGRLRTGEGNFRLTIYCHGGERLRYHFLKTHMFRNDLEKAMSLATETLKSVDQAGVYKTKVAYFGRVENEKSKYVQPGQRFIYTKDVWGRISRGEKL